MLVGPVRTRAAEGALSGPTKVFIDVNTEKVRTILCNISFYVGATLG